MRQELPAATISFDQESGIGHVRLERPDSLNALNSQLREDIISGLQWLSERNNAVEGVALRVVIVEGAGGNFCAGADIHEFGGNDRASGSATRDDREVILKFPTPIIAKIRGYCLGGGFETAMCCDFRLAHEDSRLGLPEIDLGLIPGSGGIQFVSDLANPSVAMEVAMTGDHLSANRAHDLGLVNHVYDDEAFDDKVRAFAETIASKPPLAIQAAKNSATMSRQTGLAEGRAYDRKLADTLRDTEDYRKGVRGFSDEDYEPEFQGQ